MTPTSTSLHDFASADRPIETISGDRYTSSKNADNIINVLEKTNSDRGLSIAITGPWGSGKTSALNIVKEKINSDSNLKQKYLLVEATPWLYGSSSKSSISAALAVALVQIKPEGPVNPSIKDRALWFFLSACRWLRIKWEGFFIWLTALISTLPKVGKFLGLVSKSLEGIYSLKKEVIRTLNRVQGKTVILVIDNVDRLDAHQIKELFSFTQEFLNEQKVICLIVFDEQEVTHSIEKTLLVRNGGKYLEKMFSTNMRLRTPASQELTNVFVKEYEKLFSHTTGTTFSLIQKTNSGEVKPLVILNYYLNTPRDVVLLLNEIHFSLEAAINAEIDMLDYLYIRILKVFEPKLYELLLTSRREIFLLKNTMFEASSLKVKPDKDARVERLFSLAQGFKRDAPFLHSSGAKEILSIIAPNLLMAFLAESLVSAIEKSSGSNHSAGLNNRASNKYYYDRYFNLDIGSNDIKDSEVLSSWASFCESAPNWNDSFVFLETNLESDFAKAKLRKAVSLYLEKKTLPEEHRRNIILKLEKAHNEPALDNISYVEIDPIISFPFKSILPELIYTISIGPLPSQETPEEVQKEVVMTGYKLAMESMTDITLMDKVMSFAASQRFLDIKKAKRIFRKRAVAILVQESELETSEFLVTKLLFSAPETVYTLCDELKLGNKLHHLSLAWKVLFARNPNLVNFLLDASQQSPNISMEYMKKILDEICE